MITVGWLALAFAVCCIVCLLAALVFYRRAESVDQSVIDPASMHIWAKHFGWTTFFQGAAIAFLIAAMACVFV